jgi:hypothetical protein
MKLILSSVAVNTKLILVTTPPDQKSNRKLSSANVKVQNLEPK